MKPDLDSARAKEARLASKFGKGSAHALTALALILTAAGVGLRFTNYSRVGWLALALAALFATISFYYFGRLAKLPAKLDSSKLEDALAASVLALLPKNQELNPRLVWRSLTRNWQLVFITNHFLLQPEEVEQLLSENPGELAAVWQRSREAASANDMRAVEPGLIAAALMENSVAVKDLLTKIKLQEGDVAEVASWLGRGLKSMHREKQAFGGIGRDWSFGFTPLLDRYGVNISSSITQGGANFSYLSEARGAKGIEAAFNNNAGAVVVIGEPGIGKTSQVYALAQALIEGKTSGKLAYHQIVGLDASRIIGSANQPGKLEQLMQALVSEAAHAGHIVLFLDNAELFLKNDTGSFDATRILQPLLESRAVLLILALTPGDWQRLRANNPTFAGHLTPLVVAEPDTASTMKILEDTAIGLENRSDVMIAFEAIREAYNLSGRYNQDKAYPGRAIDLLEQSVTHAQDGKIVTAGSVQAAIEQTTGVKAGTAAPAEADELLHLEDKMHERMINQTRAVSVVANALRRARAGIASPNRPIGSFLFLGPTGVGKTELAKSIAAVYFGNEQNMIRLDMSEYQQESDVSRLLASGANEASSLILRIREQPFSVVLLDEIEKAHASILNLLLQLLDEGQLTDASGKPASFKDAIVIATSNAGANEIRQRIERGEELQSFEQEFTDNLINSGQFKPELLNRFDEIVLFRPLKADELAQVVRLMLADVNRTLTNQNISVDLTDAAIAKIVEIGNDPRLGARPMRRALQRAVEDTVAQKILKGEAKPGDKITLDVAELTTD